MYIFSTSTICIFRVYPEGSYSNFSKQQYINHNLSWLSQPIFQINLVVWEKTSWWKWCEKATQLGMSGSQTHHEWNVKKGLSALHKRRINSHPPAFGVVRVGPVECVFAPLNEKSLSFCRADSWKAYRARASRRPTDRPTDRPLLIPPRTQG